jgi:hypothetical protein
MAKRSWTCCAVSIAMAACAPSAGAAVPAPTATLGHGPVHPQDFSRIDAALKAFCASESCKIVRSQYPDLFVNWNVDTPSQAAAIRLTVVHQPHVYNLEIAVPQSCRHNAWGLARYAHLKQALSTFHVAVDNVPSPLSCPAAQS